MNDPVQPADFSAYFHIADLGAQIDQVPPESIVSRTLHSDSHSKLVLFGFAAGQELSEHTSTRPATLYFVRGEGVVTLGADEYSVQAGSLIQMPPRLPHSVVAHSELLMLLIMGSSS